MFSKTFILCILQSSPLHLSVLKTFLCNYCFKFIPYHPQWAFSSAAYLPHRSVGEEEK